MKELPFSIITVCFNEAERIALTCESIVNQTLQEFEWIVIDGGSTDGTFDILKQYAHRMNHFVSQPDRGIYHAMNKGIARASGEYLLFLNGGDYLHDTLTLAKVHEAASPFHKDIYYGDSLFDRADHYKHVSVNAKNYYAGLMWRTLPHQAMFIKRALFERYGLYDESFSIAADLDFVLRVMISSPIRKQHTIEHLPIMVSVYENIHGRSTKNFKQARLEKTKARKRHYPAHYVLYAHIKHSIVRRTRTLLSRLAVK